MKRYYDLNHGTNKDYDPVARRGNGNPDFGFGEKQPTNRGKNEERSLRRNSKERMRSMGPSIRQSDKRKTEMLSPTKKKSIIGNKESSQEIKGIYEYLKKMKKIAEEGNMRESEKISKISALVKDSLALKIFDSERKNKRFSMEDVGKNSMFLIS